MPAKRSGEAFDKLQAPVVGARGSTARPVRWLNTFLGPLLSLQGEGKSFADLVGVEK